MIEILNTDCMTYMATIPDKYFDLAIVDPPYGINKDGQTETTGGHGGRKGYKKKGWDVNRPNKEYFTELFRVSKNQVIWGANYYPEYLRGTMGWLFWDKGQDINQSDGELAFTSFDCAFRRIIINRVELLKEGTIHPTQKPIKLYKYILKNYATPDFKIIDTHLGSGSSAIAAYDFGIAEFVGCEIDKEYFEAAKLRFENHKRQLTLAL
jgi:site-specific DNA-methyltransferase (adenine-specific)